MNICIIYTNASHIDAKRKETAIVKIKIHPWFVKFFLLRSESVKMELAISLFYTSCTHSNFSYFVKFKFHTKSSLNSQLSHQ